VRLLAIIFADYNGSFGVLSMKSALAIVLLSLCVHAQSASPGIDDLFRQSHDRFLRVASAENRAYGLAALLGRARSLPPSELASWAAEAYEASVALKPSGRKSYIQQVAIPFLGRADPDAALAMLLRQDPLPADALDIFNDPFGASAAQVFSAMLARHGSDAIPQLNVALQQLAEKGIYPYLALTPLMSRATPTQRTKLFQAALTAYLHSAPGITNDFEFVAFLKRAAPLPKDVSRPAAAQILSRVEQFAAADVKCVSTLRVYSDKGMTVLNCAERIMYEALPALEKMDPQTAARLKAAHPLLEQATSAPVRLTMPMKDSAQTPQGQKSQMLFDTSIMLENMAPQETATAVAMADELPDEFSRLNTVVLIARDSSAQEAQKTRATLNSVLNEANKLDNSTGKRTTLFSNVAAVAAKIGDEALLQSSIRSAFASAQDLIASLQNASHERKLREAFSGYRLNSVTHLGATAAPELTLELIPTVGDDEAEAYLLMNFADAALQVRTTRRPGALISR
jgi:hypothetical protein